MVLDLVRLHRRHAVLLGGDRRGDAMSAPDVVAVAAMLVIVGAGLWWLLRQVITFLVGVIVSTMGGGPKP